jgi:hypothetical protein
VNAVNENVHFGAGLRVHANHCHEGSDDDTMGVGGERKEKNEAKRKNSGNEKWRK